MVMHCVINLNKVYSRGVVLKNEIVGSVQLERNRDKRLFLFLFYGRFTDLNVEQNNKQLIKHYT
jgi:hypothetical protein